MVLNSFLITAGKKFTTIMAICTIVLKYHKKV